MKLIVAVDENWNIGKDGDLLIKIPDDLKRFKEITNGKAVFMGRKTLESLPNGNPLPNRTNIVLTRDKDYKNDKCVVINSVDEIELDDDIFVIGGGQVYSLMLPYCDTAYITMVHNSFDADTSFPNLDNDKNWKLSSKSELYEYNGIKYDYRIYLRV